MSDRDSRDERIVALLQAEAPALRRLAGAYEADPARRDDLVQEIALALWEALPRFRGDSSLRTFAYRIAHNQGLRHAGREAGRRQVPLEAAGVVSDPRLDPLAAATEAEESARLQAAVRELPLLLREALVLRLEGLSAREIAAVLGTSENGVMIRLSRARAMLRERLVGRGEDEEGGAWRAKATRSAG